MFIIAVRLIKQLNMKYEQRTMNMYETICIWDMADVFINELYVVQYKICKSFFSCHFKIGKDYNNNSY